MNNVQMLVALAVFESYRPTRVLRAFSDGSLVNDNHVQLVSSNVYFELKAHIKGRRMFPEPRSFLLGQTCLCSSQSLGSPGGLWFFSIGGAPGRPRSIRKLVPWNAYSFLHAPFRCASNLAALHHRRRRCIFMGWPSSPDLSRGGGSCLLPPPPDFFT
jgi:hypothetical protein